MIHYITTNGIGNAWVAAEIKYIVDEGLPVVLHSMRPPQQNFYGSDWAKKMNHKTQLIYPINILSILMSLMLAPFLFGRYFWLSLSNAFFSKRESLRARIACLFHLLIAIDWARNIRKEDITLIHSQWIQSGGTIGWYAAWLLNKPFSFTGHAVDLFRDRSALRDKIHFAVFIIAISEFHREFYINEGANPEKIHIVYCGIDIDDFRYSYKTLSIPVRILSFGRLIEKKGFDTLIEACAILRDKEIDLECEIAGSGPDYEMLVKLVNCHKLNDRVKITGKPLLQEELQGWLKQGHIFAQPCCWSRDNDVDGIPRSLMEAMACGLPSISTRVAGIPDLISDRETGLLIDQKDPEQLSKVIETLIHDTVLSEHIARGGRKRVEERFNMETCLKPLVEIYRKKLAQSMDPAVGRSG